MASYQQPELTITSINYADLLNDDRLFIERAKAESRKIFRTNARKILKEQYDDDRKIDSVIKSIELGQCPQFESDDDDVFQGLITSNDKLELMNSHSILFLVAPLNNGKPLSLPDITLPNLPDQSFGSSPAETISGELYLEIKEKIKQLPNGNYHACLTNGGYVKFTKSELGQGIHTISDITYHFTYMEDSARRRKACEAMLEKYPKPVPNCKLDYHIQDVKSIEEVENAVQNFIPRARESHKCLIIFLGHGSVGGRMCLENGVIDGSKYISVVRQIEGARLPEKPGIVANNPQKIQIILAQCYSHEIAYEMLGTATTVKALSTEKSKRTTLTSTWNYVSHVCKWNIFSLSEPGGSIDIKHCEHLELNLFAEDELDRELADMAATKEAEESAMDTSDGFELVKV